MMYDELVKRLRYCSEETSGCGLCALSDNCVLRVGLILQAVDAIEEYEFICNRYEKDYKALCAYLPKWIPVTERLPENLTSVIVHRKDGGIFVWEYFNTSPTDECWIDDSMNVYSFYDVTHWMSLPDPPKGE